ncbi:hypothetical protein LSH36_13g02129 [Paralvinella palmiformis]|uniref:Sulfotransferase n=1 Tax=Paralvinella palmiformis TaxID=53620 RepID=A0AAD9KBZ0_9ANNE|nr:hypothetical protein LSH36_13g02129 [Paralvinella palmiformis]
MFGRRHVLQLTFFLVIGFLGARFLIVVLTVTSRLSRTQIQQTYRYINMASFVNGNTDKMTFVPFDATRPKKVIILTYQRCGSSFFGQLFNTNPDVFYTYEPLDSLYSALYGIKEGWNVPSDITTYWNGSERIIPTKEGRAISIFLDHLLSCQIKSLPTETLIHRFWFLFSSFHVALRDFIKCLGTNGLKYTRCEAYTPGLCGRRFGEFGDDRLEKCNQFLWTNELRRSSRGILAQNTTKYRRCIDGMRAEVDRRCTPLFRIQCQRSELRATKVVRATMASMDQVLEQDVNVRVIHLIRDPRAVVLSRLLFDSSGRSRYAGKDVVKEATVYCRDVVRDIRRRRQLDEKYSGRLLTIIYDDLTRYPISYAEQIYKFLNASLHEKTISWLIRNTSEKKNSTKIASKWQKKLSYQTARRIMDVCKTFFAEVDYSFS